jgi:hypothetical protein
MKKIYTILAAILLTTGVFAQAPQKMSYQAIIRDAGNALVKNHSVGMKISILQGTTPVYVEKQTPLTNANGLVTIEIGGGTVISGVFSAIDWANGIYSIKTETDPNGGTAYSVTGTSQLLSVPYALNSGDNKWSSNGFGINNNSGSVGIGTTTPFTPLYVKSTSANLATFDGGSSLWITLAENGIQRGYIGSFAGNPEDVDFGTYAGNTGSVHLTTNDTPKLTVANSGNVGIGTTTPDATLHVKSLAGKIANFDGPDGSWIYFSENGVPKGYIGSFAGNADDVDFGTGGANATGSVHLTTNAGPKLTVINNGNVGIGTTTPTTKLEVNGATKLGTDAPAIKMKKLTGTTSATQGGQTSIAHGVNSAKILAVNVLVQYLTTVGFDVPPSYNANPGYEFDFFISSTDVIVWPKTGNSASILSKPIKILVTYEE